jgi:hypothetical protein
MLPAETPFTLPAKFESDVYDASEAADPLGEFVRNQPVISAFATPAAANNATAPATKVFVMSSLL